MSSADDQVRAQRLRAARERAGLTQEQLADLVGANRATVNSWESQGKRPRNHGGKLREVLGLDEHWLPVGTARTLMPQQLDDAQLISRWNVLLAEINVVAAELGRRLVGDGEELPSGRKRYRAPTFPEMMFPVEPGHEVNNEE